MHSTRKSLLPKLPGNFHLEHLYLLLTGIFLFATLGCQHSTGQQPSSTPPAGAGIFKSKCGECHDLTQAMDKYRTEGVWYATINRMKDEHHADITNKEVEELVKYHVERQQQEAEVFKKKCQKCHPGKVFLEQNLTPDQTRAIIKRMQLKAGNTISEQDVEIIIRYHTQAQQTAVTDSLQDIYRQILVNQPEKNSGMTLFLGKCSTCHEPSRALAVIKDPEIWTETIKRMQHYSKGAITDLEAKELIDFHVTEQQNEISTFENTCTKCHTEERINRRSMSEEQWLETIKRMQQKAPDLITNEKVNLLSAFFHRRELAMARIFSNKCQLCHLKNFGAPPDSNNNTPQLNGLITLANAEFGGSIQVNDVNSLLANHIERQKRNMQLYASSCTTCHPDGPPKKLAKGEEAPRKRSRAEWVSVVATIQGVQLDKDAQNNISSQIDYHISRY